MAPDGPQNPLEKYGRLEAFLRRLNTEIYPEPRSALHDQISQQAFALVQSLHPLARGALALDIGCGQGVALELFRDAGLNGVGITFGADAEACRAKGLEVRDMDFTFVEFDDESFDLVWCRHALEHSVMPYFLISEMHRVMKPGGVLYLETPAPDTACRHETNPNHYSVLGKSMILELLRRTGFSELAVRDINFTTRMGPDTYWAFIQTRRT
jgi:SAM-dependent methyltransferase